MNKTLLVLSTLLIFISASAFAESEPVKKKFYVCADTWIRENSPKWSPGANYPLIETRRIPVKKEGSAFTVIGYVHYAGLLSFDYAVPPGMKVQKAELQLITQCYKGRNVSIRLYNNDFKEKTTWWNEESNIEATLKNEPAVVFTPKGEKGKAITDLLMEDNQKLGAWFNSVDITELMMTVPYTSPRVNFLLTQDGDSRGDHNCFYSKDNEGTGEYPESDALKYLTSDRLVPVLNVTFVEDESLFGAKLLPAADTSIRKNKNASGYSSTMTIKYSLDEDNNLKTEYYGLLRFDLPLEATSDNYTVESVRLRLTCTSNRGSRLIEVYPYTDSFEEFTTFDKEADNVRTALADAPICEFEAQGFPNVPMHKYGITEEEYRHAIAWTSYIDLTDYVNSLTDKSKFGILLSRKDPDDTTEIVFATKETGDIYNKYSVDGCVPFTMAAEDIVPMLYVHCRKIGSSSVNNIEFEEDVPVEYYTLQGVKVTNPTKGLYIMKQGSKVKKIIL